MQAFWSEQSRSLLHSAAIGFIGQKERKLLRNREKEVYITKQQSHAGVTKTVRGWEKWKRPSQHDRTSCEYLQAYKTAFSRKVLGMNAILHNISMWECSFHSSQSDVSSIIPAARNRTRFGIIPNIKITQKSFMTKTDVKNVTCVWNAIGWKGL